MVKILVEREVIQYNSPFKNGNLLFFSDITGKIKHGMHKINAYRYIVYSIFRNSINQL